jgi:alpha-galactosidase
MKERIVLIGAGSAMFTRGLLTDLVLKGWDCDLSLVDIDPGALQVAAGLARKMLAARNSPISLNATTERREVLKGASVVICTISVGGRRAWEQDVFIPRKYGVFQPVGDSVMPGGASRALRMIPAMVDIARDVLELAPEALFFNYSNPMGPICRGVRKATGAEVIGLCHGVTHTAEYLEDILELKSGSLQYTAVGMNHLTWFTEARAGGRDLIPRLKEIAFQRLSKQIDSDRLGAFFDRKGKILRDYKAFEIPFSWQLMDLFGAFPAVLDRHVTEFFPHLFSQNGSYYGKTLGIDAYSLEDIIAWGDRIYEQMRHLSSSEEALPEGFFKQVGGEHEQVLDIIEAIRKDSKEGFSANLPNNEIVPNLPEEAIIECPAAADGGTLRAIEQPPLPSGLAGTLSSRFWWVETVVESALEGSFDKLMQALLLDGSVDSVETAELLGRELIDVHREYLPTFR